MNFSVEKEKMERAIFVIDKLSEGVDPYTGEIFGDEHILNNPKVVRCLKYAEEVLKEALRIPARSGNNRDLLPFSITEEEINSIEYSETPVNITHICKMLNAVAKVEEKGMRKLTAVAVNDALAEMGVVKITSFNNKRKTILSEDYKNGYGISEKEAIYNGVKAVSIVYDKEGQKFIVDHLNEILEYINSTLEQKINEINSGAGDTPTVDSNGLAKEDTTIVSRDDPNVQIVIPEGFAPAILETGRTNSMPGENGKVKSIMPVDQWNNITKEDINKGIVVVDNAITYDGGQAVGSVPDFNEYVWIPMPDSSKFARIAWHGETLGNKITKRGYWEETSSTEYTEMVDSISINKGFYISRYEASEKNSTTAQSKRGQNPWVSVSQTTAKTASSNMKSEMNSHLIYGVEWDSILQWLLDSNATIGVETGGTNTIMISDVQSDSRSWGNYFNSVGGAETNSGRRNPSGTNEYWKVNNIYDLVGNVREWTQENYSTDTLRAVRGGDYYDDGGYNPAAIRVYIDEGNTYSGKRV